MNLEECRTVFAASSLVLMLIAAAPTLSLVVPFPNGTERFSELWVLGPTHTAEDYPFNISVGEPYSVSVGVGNHLGVSSYYLVYVKFRNQTQPFPNTTISLPSPLPPLYEFRAFVVDNATWETPLTFKVLKASRIENSTFINYLAVNDVAFPVNASTTRDSKGKGFLYELFLELWLYNMTAQNFQFHNRFVGIWLNMTG